MPETTPLEWTPENLSQVISQLYAEAAIDKAVHDKLMAQPYESLNERIKVPEEYGTRILARQQGVQMLILSVPPHDATNPSASTAISPADFLVLCSAPPPPW